MPIEIKTKNKNIILLEKARAGDSGAVDELVNDNLGLVRSLARRLCVGTFEYDDLFQAGCIGLIKAIKGFDFSKGVLFSTYAVPVIAGEIKRYIRDNGPVKVSRSLKELALKVQRFREMFIKEQECEPTVSQISEYLGVCAEEIIMAYEAVAYPLSLDEPMSDDEGGRELTLGDVVADDTLYEKVDMLALKEALGKLSADDRKLITLRFFKGKTQKETADILNMTQVQISRREKKILEGMRENLSV